MRTTTLLAALSAALLAPLCVSGCASASIKMKESLGYAKREQLVDEVKDTRNAQQKAKEQFATTLDEFKSITGYNGGDLERQYNKLKDESDTSAARAQLVRDKIASVERIANAMFREWDQELAQYSSETLRGASAEQLQATRVRYRQLLEAMKKAESRMDPVITAFNDQILFLKHNLNARAIASLETTVTELETEISSLIDELNRSIDEANSFIQGMQGV
jgi:cell fate (sporulation/competence/biofilm development) regulator YmcA (YheA/YmcA/DUF963 family)